MAGITPAIPDRSRDKALESELSMYALNVWIWRDLHRKGGETVSAERTKNCYETSVEGPEHIDDDGEW